MTRHTRRRHQAEKEGEQQDGLTGQRVEQVEHGTRLPRIGSVVERMPPVAERWGVASRHRGGRAPARRLVVPQRSVPRGLHIARKCGSSARTRGADGLDPAVGNRVTHVGEPLLARVAALLVHDAADVASGVLSDAASDSGGRSLYPRPKTRHLRRTRSRPRLPSVES